MHEHATTTGPGVDYIGLVLRLLLLSSTALVAGTGLFRPYVESVSKRTSVVAFSAAAVSAASTLVSLFVLDTSVPFVLAHILLALAVCGFLRSPMASSYLGFALAMVLLVEAGGGRESLGLVVDLVFTAGSVVWLGLAVLSWTVGENERRGSWLRPAPVALLVSAALAAAAILQLVFSGIATDRRLFTSGYGLVLLLVAAASLVAVAITVTRWSRGNAWRTYRTGTLTVLVAVLSSASLPAIAKPPELPQPGVAQLGNATLGEDSIPYLITPQRPGPNLVHFPQGAGEGLAVLDASGTHVPAEPRPGATGAWAEVDLPAGRSDVGLTRGHQHGSVEVDTGSSGAVPAATGKDGPECASAVLGSLLAGSKKPVAGCPTDQLEGDDAETLTKLVGFIADHGAPGLTLVEDESPRAQRAARVVRDTAAARGVPVHNSAQQDDALLVVSGWESAHEQLSEVGKRQGAAPKHTYGIYLAPWLLHGPIANSVATASVPLRFDPRDSRSLQYGMSLDQTFPGENPSVAGLRSWLAASGGRLTDPPSVYASAEVDVMQMEMPGTSGMKMHGSPAVGQWNPRGTIVAISGPLTH